jgi:fatty acid-binding protein DegV
MYNWGYIIAKFISAVGSWIDAANLRNRVYSLQDENARLRLALEDIERMDHGGRISQYARRILNKLEGNI